MRTVKAVECDWKRLRPQRPDGGVGMAEQTRRHLADEPAEAAQGHMQAMRFERFLQAYALASQPLHKLHGGADGLAVRPERKEQGVRDEVARLLIE
jgi:hypothetical protein